MTDILNLFFEDPSNTQPYSYYAGKNMGDFLIRFFYRDMAP